MRAYSVVLGVIVLFLLGSFLISEASAQITPTSQPKSTCPDGRVGVNTELGCVPTDVGAFVNEYYGYGLGFIGGLAIMFIMYGGYTILTSKGNPVQINNGKNMIGYAIIGLLLAVFGYFFTEVISCDILKLPGFCT